MATLLIIGVLISRSLRSAALVSTNVQFDERRSELSAEVGVERSSSSRRNVEPELEEGATPTTPVEVVRLAREHSGSRLLAGRVVDEANRFRNGTISIRHPYKHLDPLVRPIEECIFSAWLPSGSFDTSSVEVLVSDGQVIRFRGLAAVSAQTIIQINAISETLDCLVLAPHLTDGQAWWCVVLGVDLHRPPLDLASSLSNGLEAGPIGRPILIYQERSASEYGGPILLLLLPPLSQIKTTGALGHKQFFSLRAFHEARVNGIIIDSQKMILYPEHINNEGIENLYITYLGVPIAFYGTANLGGPFEAAFVSPGSYVASGRTGTGVLGLATLNIESGQSRCDVRWSRIVPGPHSVLVRVMNAEGAPQAGQTVIYTASDDFYSAIRGQAPAATDAEGTTLISGLPDGRYEFAVIIDEFQKGRTLCDVPSSDPVVVTTGGIGAAHLALNTDGLAVSAVAHDEVTVYFAGRDSGWSRVPEMERRRNAWVVAGLPQHQYYEFAVKGPSWGGLGACTVEEGGYTMVPIELHPLRIARGTVVRKGDELPVQGAIVRVSGRKEQTTKPAPWAECMTSSGGSYEIMYVPDKQPLRIDVIQGKTRVMTVPIDGDVEGEITITLPL